MIKKLNESESLKFKRISPEEKEQRGILGRLWGPVASCVVPTRNGRRYSEQLWEKVFQNDIVKELFANGGLSGELQHPADREETDPEKIAIIMPEPPVKDDDGHLVGYVDILDTPCGRIAYQLAKYGFHFGISSRGTGDLISGINGEEVDPDTYQLNAFDLVAVPALKDARLTFTEALDTKKYNKTLKQALDEELNKASEKDKKIMEEALNNLELTETLNNDSEGIEEELQDTDGWGDSIVNQLEPVFSNIEDLMYEVRNGRRGSYAINGDTVKDLVSELRDLADQIEMNADDLEFNQDNLNEDIPTDPDQQRELMGILSRINAMTGRILEYDKQYDYNSEKDKMTKSFLNNDLNQIIKACQSLAKFNIKESVSEDGCSDKEDQVVEEDAGNSGDDLMKELQETLLKNKELEKDNLSLQEKLSVCNAKEKSLQDELKKYKTSTINLSEVAKEVKTLKESLEQKDKIIKSSGLRITNLIEGKKSLKDDLTEALSKIEKLELHVNELNESLSSKDDKLSKNDLTIKKYQKALQESKVRYISAKAAAYGISYDEVKQNLNESYSFKDIDSICEELSEKKLNMSKLPFRITEDTKISLKSKKDPILKGIENYDDDDVSDTLLTFIR